MARRCLCKNLNNLIYNDLCSRSREKNLRYVNNLVLLLRLECARCKKKKILGKKYIVHIISQLFIKSTCCFYIKLLLSLLKYDERRTFETRINKKKIRYSLLLFIYFIPSVLNTKIFLLRLKKFASTFDLQ